MPRAVPQKATLCGSIQRRSQALPLSHALDLSPFKTPFDAYPSLRTTFSERTGVRNCATDKMRDDQLRYRSAPRFDYLFRVSVARAITRSDCGTGRVALTGGNHKLSRPVDDLNKGAINWLSSIPRIGR